MGLKQTIDFSLFHFFGIKSIC